jgi:hypothetical protein
MLVRLELVSQIGPYLDAVNTYELSESWWDLLIEVCRIHAGLYQPQHRRLEYASGFVDRT